MKGLCVKELCMKRVVRGLVAKELCVSKLLYVSCVCGQLLCE